MAVTDMTNNVLQAFTTPAALRDRNTAIQEALRASCLLLGCESATLTMYNNRNSVRHAWRRGGELESDPAPKTPASLTRAVMQECRPVIVSEPGEDARFHPDDCPTGVDVFNAAAVPIQIRMQNKGVLTCFNVPKAVIEDPMTVQTLWLLASCIGLGLENYRLARTVRKVAVTDDLTQVYNYRFLRTALRREMKRAQRFRQDFVLLMVDVDHLKEYNDRQGHLRGSYLLRDLARILSKQVRGMDLLAKYGGDEFTVILPQTPRAGGRAVGERIRAAVEDHTFHRCNRGQMTVSVGVAVFPDDGIQPTALIAAADAALYAAKQQGRNRVLEATGLILRDSLSA